MATIDWSNDNYYLKVGMDVAGGTNFLTMGTTQLLSVPYALHAATADSIVGGVNGFSGDYNDLTNQPSLSPVATSGDYIDLINQPVTISSVSSAGDTLYLSNGQLFSAITGTNPINSHYIGEEFGGGVIFHLWKDNNGIEHGLIVDLVNLSESEYWSNVTDQFGQYSKWDGSNNSLAIVSQVGHTNSAAALCLNSANGGQNDWYLPSILELKLLWDNYFHVSKTFSQIPGATNLDDLSLWSSSGFEPLILAMDFYAGNIQDSDITTNSGWVRAIRAF
jgi:hypothetical protein